MPNPARLGMFESQSRHPGYPAKLKPVKMRNEAMSRDEPRVHMNPAEAGSRGGV